MRLLLLIIILMAACSFCGKSFANSAVAKQHEKKDCNQAQLGVSAAFKRRRARLEAANNALIRRNSKNSPQDIDKVRFHTDHYKIKPIFFIFTGRSHLYYAQNRCQSFTRGIFITAFTSMISISRWSPDFSNTIRVHPSFPKTLLQFQPFISSSTSLHHSGGGSTKTTWSGSIHTTCRSRAHTTNPWFDWDRAR